jgi:hypothetical protein
MQVCVLVWQVKPGAQSVFAEHVLPHDVGELHANPFGHDVAIAPCEQLPLPSHCVLDMSFEFAQLPVFEHAVPAG